MKVFVPENWDELKSKLSERGRVVEVRKGMVRRSAALSSESPSE